MKLPLFVLLMGIGAVAMYLPAIHAFALRDMHEARTFFYGATLFLMLTGMLGIATSNYQPNHAARSQLLSLMAAFVLLPVMLAIPFNEALRTTTFLNSYFEMVSSLTTTGATIFDNPARLPPSLHLWRAMVAWMGGFLMWVTALAILAPMNLGGFEVTAEDNANQSGETYTQFIRIADPSERLLRFTLDLLPVYVGTTAFLWVVLALLGDDALTAICHAMSVISTSGISPVGGLEQSASGRFGEILVFLFLMLAVSRMTFSRDQNARRFSQLQSDPEIRIAVVLMITIPLFLFLRHWIGAYDVQGQQDSLAALRALWGGMFTVLSFLTTTGFASADWATARDWSGLGTPGLILMGLALLGGGVATTAGGVKLLRVYALYKHGQREIERLIHPSSVARSGRHGRKIRRQGAYIAWIFFMLFALSVAAIMTLLSLTGLQFETSMVLTVAALSTTGPLASIAAETPISYAGLTDPAKIILIGAMVLGRLETLAIVALLNPEFWRS
nr:potassium transporter TrkG [Sulfitobacter algicola]